MAAILPNQLPPSSSTGSTPLPSSLGTNINPYPIKEDRPKLVEAMNALQESDKRMADLAAQQEVNKAEAYKKYIDPVVTKYEEDSKQYKDKLSKFDGIDNAFHPTQQNIPEMASIFSAVGILGSLFGGGARNSGMNALSSMTGMMEGWKIGDAEKFKREKATFDENRLQQRQQIDLIMKEWEQIAKEYTVNKEKAKADADVLIAKLGSGFLSETYRNEGLKGTLDRLFKLKKSDDDTQAHIDSVELKKATLASKQGNGGKPIKEKELNDLQGLNSLAGTLDELKKTFKPEYANLGVLGMGADISLEAKRRGFGDEDAQNAARWWANYQRLQAPNRHALFGSTLTGNELKNYQSFTAKPSDDFQYVVNSLTDQINYAKSAESSKRNNLEAAGYKIPEKLPKVNFIETYSETPSTPSSQIPTIKSQEEFDALPKGSEYYEEDGKKYRKP